MRKSIMVQRRVVLDVVVAQELLALGRCREIVVSLRQGERVREPWRWEGGEACQTQQWAPRVTMSYENGTHELGIVSRLGAFR